MLEPIFPIAIYLILGYTFKIIYHDNSKQLIEFIIYFSLPAIVFSKIYPLVLDEKILPSFPIHEFPLLPIPCV